LQPNSRFYDKARGINSLKASIADFETVLSHDGSRTDISTLLDASKEKLVSVDNHR